ncbi:aminotransferase class V-fold PLP-dependent enzyme [Prescottella equi]|uniref:aminotransferase class V-fold PLP-dependent enzyme n=1 Tax=Rhodococcus hoagii TaxID=43767 RepID=UPI0027405DA4|nr:aminotransferase class V-fold PLP-dependent enzyme [Prescottella equi]MDP8015172.1 aminotransferase class V-fold PLP-dependent enzyme [Prescottella equi]
MTSNTAVGPSVDVAAARAETPGSGLSRHLNAAGAALPSNRVLSVVQAHLRLEARVGGYEADALQRKRIDAVYGKVAALIGAQEQEIALVQSATVGWHRAIEALRLGRGDRVLVSRSSYVSSALNLMELQRTHGIEIEVVPNAADGSVDLTALADALRRPAALVTVAHVPTSSGLVEPVVEVGALCRAAGVTYLLDATQSMGQLVLDVQQIGCDILVATGRKFLRGPRGTGLLYVSDRIRESLRPTAPDVRGAVWTTLDDYELSDTAKRFETWEAPHALQLGLGAAVDEALAFGVDRIAEHIGILGADMRRRLAAIDGVTVVDPPAAGGGIVTFRVAGQTANETKEMLLRKGIRVVAVPASHGRWDLEDRGLDAVVRASVHVYNGRDDVDALSDALSGASKSSPSGAMRDSNGGATTAAGKPAPTPSWDEHTDVVVIGAGIHGSSTAWQLAKRGLRVINLEQFGTEHEEGSSHGKHRMIRRAYPAPIWYPLVDRAYEAWSELEQDAERSLVTVTGGLYARTLDAESGLDGPDCEMLDDVRAGERFPGLTLGPDFRALYDPAAGVIDAAGAMTALRELNWLAGVDIRNNTKVLDIATDGDGAVVTTAAGRIRADRVVVCAGPWTGALLPEFAPVLRVSRIVNIHVGSSRPELLAPPNLGPFSIEIPGVGLLYGIPALDGKSMKVGLDDGPTDDLDAPRKPVSQAEMDILHEQVRRFLPAADGVVEEALSCRYTMAPRNRFALSALDDRPQILVAAACSGHGFKFGPAIGVAMADLVTGTPRPDLDFLRPSEMLRGES